MIIYGMCVLVELLTGVKVVNADTYLTTLTQSR